MRQLFSIFFSILFFNFAGLSQVVQSDYEALVALYNATDGDNWHNNSNWDITNNTVDNNWYGLEVTDQRVVKITLLQNNLTGQLPPEIGNLTALEQLLLSANNLTGSIPPEIGNLTELELLYLSVNELTGEVPAELGNLTSLTSLYLNNNSFTGAIPPELGNLTALEEAYLLACGFTGDIPVFFKDLPDLTTLFIGANPFSPGPLPVELTESTSLQHLNMYYTSRTGPIPDAYFNWNSLQSLKLDANQLSGDLPAELLQLPNLTHLALSDNQLTGSLPTQIGPVLTSLSVGNNQITGPVPEAMFLLSVFDAGSNQLSGTLPESLSFVPSEMLTFAVENNQLEGSVPDYFFSATSLSTFNISNNQFSGDVPAQLTSVVSGTLDLSRNQFTGELSYPVSCRNLIIFDNQITGSLPEFNLPDNNSCSFNCTNNQLSGSIPESLTSHSHLYELKFDANQFTDISAISSANFPYSDPIVALEYNQFSFSDLLLNSDLLPFAGYTYNPQNSFPVENDTISVVEGGDLFLSISEDGENTYYQWYKGENTVSPFQDVPEFTINNVTDADTGYYHCQLTNSTYPDMVLTTRPIHVLYNYLPQISTEPDTTITVGETYLYTIAATDNDNDNLNFAADNLPGWLSFTDNANGSATLTGTPGNNDVGTVPLILEVSDGIGSVQQTFNLHVYPENTAINTCFSGNFSISPNPVSDKLLLKCHLSQPLFSNTNYTIHNTEGELVDEGRFHFPHTSIDISHFPAGWYILQLHNLQNPVILKILKL